MTIWSVRPWRSLAKGRAGRCSPSSADAISDTYKADVPAAAAISDLAKVQQMRESGLDISFEMWESAGYVGGVPVEHEQAALEAAALTGLANPASPAERAAPPGQGETDGRDGAGPKRRVWRLSIYRTGSPITLTDVLPRLQHMGVEVVDEHPYEFPGAEPFWIYDFGLRREGAATSGPGGRTTQVPNVSLASVAGQLEGALAALWKGEIEDDGFNTLVLDAGLTWRQVVVLRAYAKYLQQAGTTFSSGYIARVLRSNPVVARQLISAVRVEVRPGPAGRAGRAERGADRGDQRGARRRRQPRRGQDPACLPRPDHGHAADQLLPRSAADRTTGRRTWCSSWTPRCVPDLPAPRPKFELFVYSPRFEGVHLRFANVARGGLRWSDRREDFRTEILGLAKAQEVKNSVIVPSGAKGGFVCKQLPDPSDREAYQGEVLACYRMFISAMLDVTDNLRAGQVIPPDRVIRHDGDDPYLVVAADKGTATFSDTANEIALRRGFWLGDAFASGGLGRL